MLRYFLLPAIAATFLFTDQNAFAAGRTEKKVKQTTSCMKPLRRGTPQVILEGTIDTVFNNRIFEESLRRSEDGDTDGLSVERINGVLEINIGQSFYRQGHDEVRITVLKRAGEKRGYIIRRRSAKIELLFTETGYSIYYQSEKEDEWDTAIPRHLVATFVRNS